MAGTVSKQYPTPTIEGFARVKVKVYNRVNCISGIIIFVRGGRKMIRGISSPLVLRFLLFVFVCSVLIVQLGCSKSPEVAKTSPAVVVPSPSPTLSYQSFLDEGIDKCLNGQYKDAIPSLLKAKDMAPREGKIHFWLFQAYKNTETDASKKSKAYIAAQSVIALMPGSPQEQQAQEFVNSTESVTQQKQFTPPPQVTATKSPQVSTQQPQIINTPSHLKKNITPEVKPPTLSQGNNWANSPVLSENDAKKAKDEFKKKLEKEKSRDQIRDRENAQRQHEKQMKEDEYQRRCAEERNRRYWEGMKSSADLLDEITIENARRR